MNFKNVAYWAILIFLAAIFLIGGVDKLTAVEYWQARFVSQWGLPAWMAPMIGATEMLPEVGEVYFRAGPKRARELISKVLERLSREGALEIDNPPRVADHFIHLCVSGLLMPRLLAVQRTVEWDKHAADAVTAFLRLYGSGHRVEL